MRYAVVYHARPDAGGVAVFLYLDQFGQVVSKTASLDMATLFNLPGVAAAVVDAHGDPPDAGYDRGVVARVEEVVTRRLVDAGDGAAAFLSRLMRGQT